MTLEQTIAPYTGSTYNVGPFQASIAVSTIRSLNDRYKFGFSEDQLAAGLVKVGETSRATWGDSNHNLWNWQGNFTADTSPIGVALQTIANTLQSTGSDPMATWWNKPEISEQEKASREWSAATYAQGAQVQQAIWRAANPELDTGWGSIFAGLAPYAAAIAAFAIGVPAFAAETTAADAAYLAAVDASAGLIPSTAIELSVPTAIAGDSIGSFADTLSLVESSAETAVNVIAEQAAATVVDATIKTVESSLLSDVVSTAKAVNSVLSPITSTISLVNRLTGQTTTVPKNSAVPSGWTVAGPTAATYDPATGVLTMETPQGNPQQGATPQSTDVIAPAGTIPAGVVLAGIAALVLYLVR